PTINQSAIRQLIDDHFTAALEAQAANMANTGNINRNPKQAHIARKCRYKEFMSCQPFNFKGSEGAVELICWFECTESVFSSSNCIEDCKVKFATGNVTASKPQILEEAINIAHRLMDQVTKHNHLQETNDQKRNLDDKRNTNNNNYPNNHDNNNYPNTRNNNNHSNNRINNNNNYQDNCNNNKRNNDHHHQQNGRHETMDMMDLIPSVGNVHCITQDHSLLGVRIATK
nr:hypothetical protein [Tanacetum cinerariifolium]